MSVFTKAEAKSYLEDNNFPTEFNDKGKEALLKACKQGETQIVQAYIALEFALDYQYGSNGITPLVSATEGNRIEIIKLLLEVGAAIEYWDGDKDTALMTAINWQKTEATTALIEAGANINLLNKNSWAPITRSIHLKNQALFDILIAVPSINIHLGVDKEISALHFAINSTMNRIGNCRKILEKGFNPNYLQNKEKKRSFLIQAVTQNIDLAEKKELIGLLLKHGADINHENIDKETAWSLALYNNQQELADWLVTKGALIDESKLAYLDFLNAIKNGNLSKVQQHIAEGIDINQKDNQDKTTLMWSAQLNQPKITKCLIEHGVELNIIDNSAWTALSYASFYDSVQCFELLIAAGANPNDQPNYARSLINACRKNQLAMAKILLEKGAYIDSVDTRQQTSLALAASKGYIELVELLLQYKPNLEIPTEKGSSALSIAAYNNQVEVAQKLIDAGALLDSQDDSQDTPLIKVCNKYYDEKSYEQAQIAKLLLEAGADYSIRNFYAVQVARRNNHIKCIKVLEDWLTTGILERFKVQYGLDAASTDLDDNFYKAFVKTQNTETLKQWIKEQNLEMISQLLKAGLSPNPATPNLETPLNIATYNYNPASLKLLLAYNVDINQANKYKQLPIFVAAKKGNATNISILLEHGAKADILNDKGQHPLHVAILSNRELDVVRTLFLAYPEAALVNSPVVLAASMQGGKEILAWLIESVCLYIDSVDEDKNTALLKAIKKRNHLPTQYLIEQGANPNVFNTDYETPLYLACINNDTELAKQLLQAGADPAYSQKGISISKAIGNRRNLRQLLQQYSTKPIEAKGVIATPVTTAPVSPLFHAVHTRNLAQLNTLIEMGTNVNQTNYRGDTPLMMAAARGYMDVVELLLNAGASVDAQNDWQDTAWTYSTLVGDHTFLERNEQLKASAVYKKLEKTLNPNQQAGLYLRVDEFRAILNKGNFRKINDFLDQKSIAINFLDAANTPITKSIAKKDLNIIEFLLQKGADPNIPNGLGQTPLQLAIRYETQDILELLLEYKANPNLCCTGQTNPPLHTAIQKGLSAFVYMLLNAGANPKRKNSIGLDAFALAQKLYKPAILELLENASN